jgi:hypothetical protein
MLRPAFQDPDRLVMIWGTCQLANQGDKFPTSAGNYLARKDTKSFAELAVVGNGLAADDAGEPNSFRCSSLGKL